MDGVGEDVDLVAPPARARAMEAWEASLLGGKAFRRDRRHANAISLAEGVDLRTRRIVGVAAERVDGEGRNRSRNDDCERGESLHAG